MPENGKTKAKSYDTGIIPLSLTALAAAVHLVAISAPRCYQCTSCIFWVHPTICLLSASPCLPSSHHILFDICIDSSPRQLISPVAPRKRTRSGCQMVQCYHPALGTYI